MNRNQIIYYLSMILLGISFGVGQILFAESGVKKVDELLRLNKFDEAIAEYKRVLQSNPEDIELRVKYARVLVASGLYEQAINEFEQVLIKDPNNRQAGLELGLILKHYKGYDKVVSSLNRVKKLSLRSIRIRLLLADVYQQKEEWDLAITEYEEIINLSADINAFIGLGECYLQKKQFKQAEIYFKRAQSIDRNNGRIYLGLAKINFARKNYKRTIADLEIARALNYDVKETLRLSAKALLKNKDYTQLTLVLKQLLSRKPHDYAARLELAGAFLSLEQYQAAISELRRIPDSSDYVYQKYIGLAFAYGAMNDFEMMWRYLTRKKAVIFILISLGVIFSLFFIGIIGILFFLIFLTGRKQKKLTMSFGIKWNLPGAFFVSILLFLLPPFLGAIAGKVFFNEWLFVFMPAHKISNQSVQVALLSQLLAVIFICGLIFWMVAVKSKQSITALGFKAMPIKNILKISFVSATIIFVFNYAYLLSFIFISGHTPSEQFINKVISSAREIEQIMPLLLIVVLIGPLCEEIIFRGFIFSCFRRYADFKLAAISSALLFGLFHFQLSLIIPITFMGVVFAFLFERTRSIFPAIVAHLCWNLFSFSSIFISR